MAWERVILQDEVEVVVSVDPFTEKVAERVTEQEARDWLALKEASARTRNWVVTNVDANTIDAIRTNKNGTYAPKARRLFIRQVV